MYHVCSCTAVIERKIQVSVAFITCSLTHQIAQSRFSLVSFVPLMDLRNPSCGTGLQEVSHPASYLKWGQH